MNFRQGVSEAGEGVYTEYMTEADTAYHYYKHYYRHPDVENN